LRVRSAVLLVVALGCSSDPPAPVAPPPAPRDAGVDGITEIGSVEPGALDGDPRSPRTPQARFKNRPPRPIDIMLRSTPPGAMAAVDGVQVGYTPAYWYGESDGREHEFTFVRANHAVARYRFVPIQSGTVHVRLEPVAAAPLGDAGAGEDMALPPPEPAVPPPATVLAPDASPLQP
jgi:hypothetical protein